MHYYACISYLAHIQLKTPWGQELFLQLWILQSLVTHSVTKVDSSLLFMILINCISFKLDAKNTLIAKYDRHSKIMLFLIQPKDINKQHILQNIETMLPTKTRLDLKKTKHETTSGWTFMSNFLLCKLDTIHFNLKFALSYMIQTLQNTLKTLLKHIKCIFEP